jgi:amidase
MQRITRDKLTPVFDRRTPPVAHVVQGEVFVVETEDSRGGRTRLPEHTTPEYLLAMRRQGYHGNPVTGPVFIERAQPGDTLAVHILDQKCDTIGYMGYWPFLFHLEDYFPQPATVLTEIQDGHVLFADDVRIPVRPVIGTIGVAPAVEAILSGAWVVIAAMWTCRRSQPDPRSIFWCSSRARCCAWAIVMPFKATARLAALRCAAK